MGIVKQYHKDTDTTYVYESFSYYDKDKKRKRQLNTSIYKLIIFPYNEGNIKGKEISYLYDSRRGKIHILAHNA